MISFSPGVTLFLAQIEVEVRKFGRWSGAICIDLTHGAVTSGEATGEVHLQVRWLCAMQAAGSALEDSQPKDFH